MVASPLLMAEKARARLRSIVTTLRDNPGDAMAKSLPLEADLVLTPCEVNQLHGTGTLLYRLFPDSSSIISLRTSDFYGEPQTFGAANFCLPLGQSTRPEIAAWIKWWLQGTRVRRIITFPYLPMDPVVAIALKELFNAPLCTYVMDDKQVCAEGISDELMKELLLKSDLRLVISPEMRNCYEKRYGMKFWLMPPLVPESIIQRHPRALSPGISLERGVLLGNIWGQRWLDMLRDTFRGSGFHLDWYCNQRKPAGLTFNAREMERDGIRFMEPIAEPDLPGVLSQYPYAVVPSDTLDGQSPPDVRAIAELSLPSRIPTILSTSHLPFLVLGHPNTAAARFVRRFDLGEVTPYDTGAMQTALRSLASGERQTDIRARAAELTSSFSSEGAAEWIWNSLAEGRARDGRYEKLMPTEHE